MSDKIEAALAKMQGELKATEKGAKAIARGSKEYAYSTIADVWDAIRKPLSDNGLSITQTEGVAESWITLTTTLRHTSGEKIEGSRPIATVERAMNDPQAYGSALTYARRYGITAMVGIAPADDDDGASAKAAPRQSMGQTMPTGPRGGTDKTPPGEHEFKLYGYPGGHGPETKTYPRTLRGVTAFVEDLEHAVATDMTQWDINQNGIALVKTAIEKIGDKALHDRLMDIEANITVERASA